MRHSRLLVLLVIPLLVTACAPFQAVVNQGNTNSSVPTNSVPPITGVSLDLSNKGLTKLPSTVLSTTNLEQLDISYNNLTGALPAEIRQLSRLKVLRAGHNAMTGVPAEIGQLSNLEELDLSYNKLTGLPYELGNLQKLKILRLTGNDYSRQDLDKIKQSLPSTVTIEL